MTHKFLNWMLLAFLTLGTVVFTQCKDDDDSSTPEQQPQVLSGTWNNGSSVWKFNEDGSGTKTENNSTTNFTYSSDGNKIKVVLDSGNTETFTLEDDVLKDITGNPLNKGNIITPPENNEPAQEEFKLNVTEGEWIDLGLPSGTLWASHNIGATKPDETGDFYQWAALSFPSDNNYSYSTSSIYKLSTVLDYKTKGIVNSSYVLVDDYDVAIQKIGNGAHIPSVAQLEELINKEYCSLEWIDTQTYGCKITSKINGNSIFIAAGGQKDETMHFNYHKVVEIYSNLLDRTNSKRDFVKAVSLQIRSANEFIITGIWNTYIGLNIRPVKDKEQSEE